MYDELLPLPTFNQGKPQRILKKQAEPREFGCMIQVPSNLQNAIIPGLQVQEFLHKDQQLDQDSYEQPYLLQRQIWERQLQLSRLRDQTNRYEDLKALEQESRKLIQDSRLEQSVEIQDQDSPQ